MVTQGGSHSLGSAYGGGSDGTRPLLTLSCLHVDLCLPHGRSSGQADRTWSARLPYQATLNPSRRGKY